jgi:hypothetical protein
VGIFPSPLDLSQLAAASESLRAVLLFPFLLPLQVFVGHLKSSEEMELDSGFALPGSCNTLKRVQQNQ